MAFFCFLFSYHLLSSSKRLEFIPKNFPLRLLWASHKSSLSAIWYVLWISHTNHRGSTQSELQSLRCFSPFFIQCPFNVIYQSSHVTSWATYSWILTYCIPYLDCPSLTEYTYFPNSALGYFPPLMYFRTSRLGYFILRGDIFTLLVYLSMPCITFMS